MKDKTTDYKLEKLSYEEAMSKLEEIVAWLENSDIMLEESLSAFQQGIALSRYCRKKLSEIEFKVEYLLKEEQQSLQDQNCENEDEAGEPLF